MTAPATMHQEQEFVLSVDRASIANMFFGVKIAGPLDLKAIQLTLDTIVTRHASLRTTLADSRGGVVQLIHPPCPVRLEVVDLGASVDDWNAVKDRLAVSSAAPFDLSRPPMLRCELLRASPEEHLLVVCVAHAAADARSRGLFFREFARTYVGLVTHRPFAPPHLPMQPADVAIWERNGRHTPALRYWRHQLGGLTSAEMCPLASDSPLSSSAEHERAMPRSDAHTTTTYAEFGRRHSASPALLTIAGIAVVAHRHTGQGRVVVSLVHHNRLHPGLRDLIGCLIDAIPIVVDLRTPVSLTGLVTQLAATLRNAEAHSLPWALARELLGGPVDVGVNFVRDPRDAPLVAELASGKVVVEQYTPLYHHFVTFPVRRGWLGVRMSFESLVHSDDTTSNAVCYFPPALDSSTADELYCEVHSLLARGLAEPTEPLD